MKLGTIGSWSPEELSAFIRDQFVSNIQTAGTSFTCDSLLVTATAVFADQLQFQRTVSVAGSAGSASTLPANPAGYIPILDYTGSVKLIPYYNS